jgi:hypothetical protein
VSDEDLGFHQLWFPDFVIHAPCNVSLSWRKNFEWFGLKAGPFFFVSFVLD